MTWVGERPSGDRSYIYNCIWRGRGHQAYMRSERDAGKKPNEECEGGTYRLIPPRDEDGIKKLWLGGMRITHFALGVFNPVKKIKK